MEVSQEEMDISERSQHLSRSQSPLLDENTSFTTTAQIAKLASLNQLNRSSFQLDSKEDSSLLSRMSNENVSSTNIIMSATLESSLCASVSEKKVTKNNFMLRNKIGKAKTVELGLPTFQEAYNQSTDIDDSFNKNTFVSNFCKTRQSKAASVAKKSDFQSLFNSSDCSVNLSKMSTSLNSQDNSIVSVLSQKPTSVFLTKKKPSVNKNLGHLDFQDAFQPSADDSIDQFPRNKRLNSDPSNEIADKKRYTGFQKTRKNSRKENDCVGYQKAFDSSVRSQELPQENNCPLEDNNVPIVEDIIDNVPIDKSVDPVNENEPDPDNELRNSIHVIDEGNGSSFDKVTDEPTEDPNKKVVDNNPDQSSNSEDPKDDINELINNKSLNKNCENQCNKETGLCCSPSADNEFPTEVAYAEKSVSSKSPDKPNENPCLGDVENCEIQRDTGHVDQEDQSSHISGIDCEENDHVKTLRDVAVSFSYVDNGNLLHVATPNKETVDSEMDSRSYISNISIQQNTLPCTLNYSVHASRELEKPDSVSSIVLRLDDYDSMDSSSESEDENRDNMDEENSNELRQEEKTEKVLVSQLRESESNISEVVSRRRSPRISSFKNYSNCNKSDQSGNSNEKSLSKSGSMTKSNSAIDNPSSRSHRLEGSAVLRSWSGFKTNSRSGMVLTEINENYNSMEITADTVADQSSLNLTDANRDKSVFKVPNIDISLRARSSRTCMKNKSSVGSQNVSIDHSYVSFQNASVDSSNGSKSSSRTSKRKSPMLSNRNKRRSQVKDKSPLNYSNRSKNETPDFSVIERRFPELRNGLINVHNKENDDCLLANKVLSFQKEKFPVAMLVDDSMTKSKNFKLRKPKRWVSDHLYNFLVSKLEPKYDFKARRRAETFVGFLCDKYDSVLKEEVEFKKHVDELVLEMAKLRLIINLFDFYDFVHTYLPYDFYKKSVPGISAFGKPPVVQPIPPGTIFNNIL